MIDLLLRLAPRERLLIGLLAVVVLPAALWLGWAEPLAERRAASVAALEEARALDAWVAARVAEKTALEALGDTGPRTAIGLSALEQSLIDAGLRSAVSDLARRGAGGIELRFETVEFGDLMGWLGRSDPGWGYDIAGFRIVRGEAPGLVSADLRLEPQE
ncbi:type II secretion system protein GspM [Aestuariicoccus sp. MJ-SS9]|uniref:type II secretion system protein GspM n=1 Tax=Aestuariicoccus sp. MJ-SS9 TaxID=3079855 RepID=UPI0029072FC6|nr:type II secretion system protein GspM [Aestuariicoccus sp. MJ-SS9]MDU8912181.1 type II secretion system protein GspM [Aestuariicoccus sp. MJ-SS9]